MGSMVGDPVGDLVGAQRVEHVEARKRVKVGDFQVVKLEIHQLAVHGEADGEGTEFHPRSLAHRTHYCAPRYRHRGDTVEFDLMTGSSTWSDAAELAKTLEDNGFSGMLYTETGQVPFREWPVAIKGKFITRHPPLPEAE